MIEITKYRCDFCVEDFFEKEDCLTHERHCTFNPENTTCYTCEFFKRDESDEYDFGFNTNLCMKYDKRDTREFEHNGHCKDWELKKSIKIKNITKDF